jgi:DNA-binding MarR family transcriptional regulator
MTARTIDRAERSNGEAAAITQILALLDPLFAIRATLPARAIQAFLLVAQKEGLSVGEYAKRAGLSPTSMSRNLLDMGERDRNFEEGAGLVEGKENVLNRREKLYSLTPKGRALLASIVLTSEERKRRHEKS